MIRGFEEHNESGSDYVVGWVDGFGTDEALGRGQIHVANYFAEGEDPAGVGLVTPDDQNLPERFFLVIPKRWMWWLARPLSFRLGMKLVNAVRYLWGSLPRNQHHFVQTHTAFNHLLDYVPSWKRF